MQSPIYTIPGVPHPQFRPRFKRNGHVYDPQSQLKRSIGYDLTMCRNDHYDEELILNCPLQLYITFFMPISKSLTKKLKKELPCKPHAHKPDIDNLLKFTLDCANHILFLDDSLIYSVNSQKIYSENPRTEFYFIYGESENEEKVNFSE